MARGRMEVNKVRRLGQCPVEAPLADASDRQTCRRRGPANVPWNSKPSASAASSSRRRSSAVRRQPRAGGVAHIFFGRRAGYRMTPDPMIQFNATCVTVLPRSAPTALARPAAARRRLAVL